MKSLMLLTIVTISLYACANPLNRETARQYYGGGIQNQNKGDWKTATESFRRAYINTQLGNLSEQEAALYAYEYGRTSGAICDWSNAKIGLDKALELDTKLGNPLHFDLVELALMHQAKGEYTISNEYFLRTIESLDKHKIRQDAPAYYADTLLQHSKVLYQLGDIDQSETVHELSKTIANTSTQTHKSIPYGQHCD